jgi:hypothetical protein
MKTPAAIIEDVGTIDPDQLDKEWLKQPRLYISLAAEAADARQQYESMKAALSEHEASLASKIRTDPESFGISKPTEKAIEEAVRAAKKTKRLEQELAEAKYELDMAQVAVQACSDRREALKHLTQLWMASYYGSAPAPVTREQADDYRREKRKPKPYVPEGDR